MKSQSGYPKGPPADASGPTPDQIPVTFWNRSGIKGLVMGGFRRVRLLRRGVVYFGVTGSAGKTTTKDLITHIMKTQGRVSRTPGTSNGANAIMGAMLRATPFHRACVMEIAAWGPNTLQRLARLAEPDITVVTRIMRDHYSAFRSSEAVAQEKGFLVEHTRPRGVAVLNADDPLVLAMRTRSPARVITFGLSPEADIRAEEVAGDWPDPLHGVFIEKGERHAFQTQLYGTHQMPSVLAAAAATRAAGVAWPDIVRGLAAAPRLRSRMNPIEMPGGYTIMDDSWKAPWDGLPMVFDYVRKARANRKIFIFGHISDYPGSASSRLAIAAREALTVADLVIFARPLSNSARKGTTPENAERLHMFGSLPDLHASLDALVRPGDLVFLKGSARPDHLERLWMARKGSHRCWAVQCGFNHCTVCKYSRRPRRGDESVPQARGR